MTNANKLLIFSLIFKLRFCDIFFINLPKITATCVYHMSVLWGTIYIVIGNNRPILVLSYIIIQCRCSKCIIKKEPWSEAKQWKKKEFIVLLNIKNNMIYYTNYIMYY